jgi:hypothetical protein
MIGLVLHVHRELIHHGAEINLLRDLYRAGQAADPLLEAVLAGGDLPILEVLVELGADLAVVDARWQLTPLGWARHVDQQAAADYLAGLGGGRRPPGVAGSAGLTTVRDASGRGQPFTFRSSGTAQKPFIFRSSC